MRSSGYNQTDESDGYGGFPCIGRTNAGTKRQILSTSCPKAQPRGSHSPSPHYGIWVVAWPAKLILMTPPQVQLQIDTSSSAD